MKVCPSSEKSHLSSLPFSKTTRWSPSSNIKGLKTINLLRPSCARLISSHILFLNSFSNDSKFIKRYLLQKGMSARHHLHALYYILSGIVQERYGNLNTLQSLLHSHQFYNHFP